MGELLMGASLPFLGMVFLQAGFAGMNIMSKLALDSGMSPFILVAYRQIFATIAISPMALYLEREYRPKITRHILLQILLCSIFGATGNQIFYFIGLKNATPTVACALSNVLPAVTFILAVLFRLETLCLKSKAGVAKVWGTLVCVGGAMLLSFYHGTVIGIGESHRHWKLAEGLRKGGSSDSSTGGDGGNLFLGPFLVILSCFSWAAWFIIQARLTEMFAAPYTNSALMCFMASIQSVAVAGLADHRSSAWSLTPTIRLIASLYAGLVGSALAVCLMAWCIQRKGPLYVSVFSPLLLIIVAALSWALLQDKLYVGTVIGSVLIVAGLYAVLWGKNKERNPQLHQGMGLEEDAGKQQAVPGPVQEGDLEMHILDPHVEEIKPHPTS